MQVSIAILKQQTFIHPSDFTFMLDIGVPQELQFLHHHTCISFEIPWTSSSSFWCGISTEVFSRSTEIQKGTTSKVFDFIVSVPLKHFSNNLLVFKEWEKALRTMHRILSCFCKRKILLVWRVHWWLFLQLCTVSTAMLRFGKGNMYLNSGGSRLTLCSPTGKSTEKKMVFFFSDISFQKSASSCFSTRRFRDEDHT